MVNLGESVKNGNLLTLLVGRNVAGEVIMGKLLAVLMKWYTNPPRSNSPTRRNLDTHRCHHMLYKDTWTELMLGEQQGAGVGEQNLREA